MYKILITARTFGKYNDLPYKILKDNGCEFLCLPYDGGDLTKQLADHIVDADGIIAGLEPYDVELLHSARKLKVISRYGVGYDKIDLAAARAKNIDVTNTPGANEDAVADLTIALMLAACRSIPYMDCTIKKGASVRPTGTEMWKKTLGVIGLGRIGKGVVKRAKGFQMNILCCDLYPDEAFAKEYGVTNCDLDTLLRSSDFITIHTPLTEDTRNMLNTKQFQMMKKNAVIVNTARGGIINEDALYRALTNGTILAAGLDATVCEPPTSSPLAKLENCILTPHAGAATYEAAHSMSMMATENMISVLNGVGCKYVVNA